MVQYTYMYMYSTVPYFCITSKLHILDMLLQQYAHNTYIALHYVYNQNVHKFNIHLILLLLRDTLEGILLVWIILIFVVKCVRPL